MVDYPACGYLPVNIACFSPFVRKRTHAHAQAQAYVCVKHPCRAQTGKTKKGSGVLLCNCYSVEGEKFFLNLELISFA